MNYTEMLFNRDERLIRMLNDADNKNLELIVEINKQEEELERYKNIAEEIQTELFDIKDMIYKPETREENMPTQRKISEVIKKLEELKGE